MTEQNDKVNNSRNNGTSGNFTKKTNSSSKKPLDTEGEYIDYEEIK